MEKNSGVQGPISPAGIEVVWRTALHYPADGRSVAAWLRHNMK